MLWRDNMLADLALLRWSGANQRAGTDGNECATRVHLGHATGAGATINQVQRAAAASAS